MDREVDGLGKEALEAENALRDT
ncbi:hypothetical protein BOTNAR_0224g00170 [Botryotinia narcissicola]|uniref:Uncharacterized protein n=2 Tax=Sclerotiniaceae TaxID=28983 RepID=A0A4Z1I524_9HELO|nr:hypothetical protein BOTNAR_0224g00170 [Botryotinia narcissicola]